MNVPYHRLRKEVIKSLTPRERQLGRLIARAYSNKAIAAELLLTEATVKVYVQRMYGKLGMADDPRVNTRVAAALLFGRLS